MTSESRILLLAKAEVAKPTLIHLTANARVKLP